MKKVFAVLFFINCFLCFAQVSADMASRKTAERCLKLSESYLLSGNVDAALEQADLGILYDDNISDLYYIKAAAKKMQGATVREVLELSKIANDKDSWAGYNEKGNRILYADLLSDTGSLVESLEILDREPLVFSADAEAIRLKNYYRIGTDEYLEKAREKVNTSRRIFKGDVRFLSLFFSFEISRCIKGGPDYVIEPYVMQLASLLNEELKSYKTVSDELKCLSIFFMEGEEQIRAIKAFDANGGVDSLYPIIALKAGVLSESDAFDVFFEFADKAVPMELMKYFASMLKEDETMQKLYEHLNAYSGTLYADLDSDMQAEISIEYERGRPQYIHYDYDNDGNEDLYGTFDFGELLSVCIKPFGTEIYYSPYPWVGHVVMSRGEESMFFDFPKNAAKISPLSFDVPPQLQVEGTENRFYIPTVKQSWDDISNLEFLNEASFVRGSSPERENATVTYSILDGQVVSAVYSSNGVSYATADFQDNLPFKRLVDYDNDGVFETVELFMPYDEENTADGFSDDDKEQIKTLFPHSDYSDFVYFAAVLIDRDNDNFPEFQEVYMGNGGKSVTWATLDGKYQTYIRYPHEDDSPVVEESIFVTGINKDKIVVQSLDGIPSSVEMNGISYGIVSGSTNNFYWIGKGHETSDEKTIIKKLSKIEQGTVILVETKGRMFTCIKVGSQIFAREAEAVN